MTDSDRSELRRWARDTANEATDWETDATEDDDDAGDIGSCLDTIRDEAESLIRLLDRR